MRAGQFRAVGSGIGVDLLSGDGRPARFSGADRLHVALRDESASADDGAKVVAEFPGVEQVADVARVGAEPPGDLADGLVLHGVAPALALLAVNGNGRNESSRRPLGGGGREVICTGFGRGGWRPLS